MFYFSRSNFQTCSIIKIVIRNFAKFTEKNLCQSLFLNKVAGLSNFIKKETLAQVFSCQFSGTFKNTHFREHLRTTVSGMTNRPIFYHQLFQRKIILAYWNSWTLDARVGLWTLDSGPWTLDSGRWTLDAGLWTLGAGLWTLDFEPWTLDAER